jgi:hypothetical protein
MRGTAFTACANSRRASPAVLILAGLCACADAPAQDTDELVIKGSEVIDPQERISGGAVTGASFGYTGPTGKVALDELWAYFGGGGGVSEVRVQITSIDGRYLATFNSEIQDPPIKGWRQLKPEPDKPEKELDKFLSNYSTDKIAVLVTSEPAGGDPITYPARWGRCSLAKNVRVFVNAEGADAIFEFFGTDGQWQHRACRTAGPGSFKFDRICSVPVSHFQKYANVKNDKVENDGVIKCDKNDVKCDKNDCCVEIDIFRKRGARYARPIVAKALLLPDNLDCPTGETPSGGSGDD